MVEQVLALQEPDLELPTDDQVLVSQAGHLLEEPDITNVLNTIQPDEFNDFFSGNVHLSTARGTLTPNSCIRRYTRGLTSNCIHPFLKKQIGKF